MPKTSFTEFDLYKELMDADIDLDEFLDYVAKSDTSGEIEKLIISMDSCENKCNAEKPCKFCIHIHDKMNKINENDNKKLELLNEQKNVLNDDEVLAQNNKMLSSQQQKALQWLDDGINFFLTGSAGCGKSYIVKEIDQSIQIYKTIHITASSGKAAHLLNGVTIHAFAGIETGVKSVAYYKRHMHPDIKKTWLETDVLIIDEISMINAQTFDLLHLIACEIKQWFDEFFGGIQVIACGDFFQLPPIKREFVFKSKIWQQYMTEVLILTECFKQKKRCTIFWSFKRNTNVEVDFYNNDKMKSIKNEGYWFYAKDVIKNPNKQCSFQIPAAVYLKIGAIVMLVRNINVEEGLCNGTVGTVILIENNAVWVNMNGKEVKIECVKEEILDCCHAVVCSRLGLPLKLAFSFTVHKAQGCTMNKAVVKFNSKAFNNSLYYVSLSRVCNINDIFIIINNKLELQKIFKSITVDSDVLEFYKKYM
ncbi:ATP-dependent DNA helicase PIF1-like [Hydra vulgaris]|uniref:ATP-dependent DNA helicase n=1 Tax=Hydra vulgaris TaxID=6087 RepID=A0ABM4DFS2_HYDVU